MLSDFVSPYLKKKFHNCRKHIHLSRQRGHLWVRRPSGIMLWLPRDLCSIDWEVLVCSSSSRAVFLRCFYGVSFADWTEGGQLAT